VTAGPHRCVACVVGLAGAGFFHHPRSPRPGVGHVRVSAASFPQRPAPRRFRSIFLFAFALAIHFLGSSRPPPSRRGDTCLLPNPNPPPCRPDFCSENAAYRALIAQQSSTTVSPMDAAGMGGSIASSPSDGKGKHASIPEACWPTGFSESYRACVLA